MEFGDSATLSYPLVRDDATPKQKRETVDCVVYVMRFIEQLLNGEKLRLPHADVPFWRLKYVTRILKEGCAAGIIEKGDSSAVVEKHKVTV